LMPSEPEVKSSRLPCPLLLAPLFFKIEEMAPAILWSGLALPKLSFRFKIPCTGGSGDDLEVAPDVPAEAEISPSMMRSSWLLRFLSMDWGNSSSQKELFLDLTKIDLISESGEGLLILICSGREFEA